MGDEPRTTTYRLAIPYYQADQQGIVFNMWYLAWFDEAFTLFLAEGGLPYLTMTGSGHDVRVVHTDIDWTGPARWPEEAAVEVSLERVGRTSFSIRFDVSAAGRPVATGRTVYVVVSPDGAKQPVPALIADALGPPRA